MQLKLWAANGEPRLYLALRIAPRPLRNGGNLFPAIFPSLNALLSITGAADSRSDNYWSSFTMAQTITDDDGYIVPADSNSSDRRRSQPQESVMTRHCDRNNGTSGASSLDEDKPSTPKRIGRGKAFSADEMLHLAKAWIQQSAKGCNQHERSLWEGIADICKNKYNMERTSASLRSTWNRTAREAQHFIASRMRVRAMNISGADDDMLEEI
eukprot:IDg2976t1